MSPLRGRTKEPDETCAQAVDLARAAAEEMAGPAGVGEHLAMTADGDRVVTHLFRSLDPAYRGWCWAVTVARASRSKHVTVSESLLLPGDEAILAPDWVPWRERLRPGDLGPGDLLPAAPDDARLVPMATLDGDDGLTDWGESSWAVPGAELAGLDAAGTDDDESQDQDETADAADSEDGAGAADGTDASAATAATRLAAGARASAAPDTVPLRARVLSAIGRDDTALRWYTSEHGPKTPLAHAAPGLCASCGFYVRLAGPLGQVFGVCANAYAPDDGRVVSVDHGCGAHSEAVFTPSAEQPLRPVIDELGYDLVDMPGVSVEETVFESLEHN
ncbi:MAG TPA: DUF3027 domain-containing protein [Streptosporangiaceae bacterium]